MAEKITEKILDSFLQERTLQLLTSTGMAVFPVREWLLFSFV